MKNPFNFGLPLLVTVLVAQSSFASEYFMGPTGSPSAACTQAAPCALNYNMSGKTLIAGDIVYLLGGAYSGQYIRPSASGTASAWITFKAVDGQLPILDGNGSAGCGIEPSAAVQYVRFVGIASRNWNASGFSNGWNTPSSKIEFINCIADGNGINGIAFYKATGVLIQQNIVAHNGNMNPSWSSGVNLYTAGGSYLDNVVRQTVSFENIDISSYRSDGSGFILDFNSTGATFENNIGFHNGGSCIRLTNSSGSHVVNNTCVGNGIDPNVQYHQEIFYSDSKSTTGAVLRNNVLVASSGNVALEGSPSTSQNNVPVNAGGSAAFFVSSSGALDFHLVSGATSLINQGSASEAPTTDIGFDAKCIKPGSPGGASWWSHVIDYAYITSIGGVAACFKPSSRTAPADIGAYEFTAAAAGGGTGTGGAASTGGAPAAGGSSTTARGGSPGVGGTASSGGTTNTTTGGAATSGGASTSSGGSGGSATTARGGAANSGGASTTATTGGAMVTSSSGGSVVLSGNGGNNASGGVPSTSTGPTGNVGIGGVSTTGSGTTLGVAGSNSAMPAGEVGGCGCRVAAEPSHSKATLGLGLFSLFAFLRLRRRKASR